MFFHGAVDSGRTHSPRQEICVPQGQACDLAVHVADASQTEDRAEFDSSSSWAAWDWDDHIFHNFYMLDQGLHVM